MARVVFSATLKPYTGGRGEVEVDATDIRRMLNALGAAYPKLKPILDQGVAVAVDGEIYRDAWFQPIRPDSEVHILPRLAGG